MKITSYEPEDLPKYAVDYSEFFYGALIERKADSLDLHVTMFLVSHLMTADTFHVAGVENSQIHKWKKMILLNKNPLYEQSGIRSKARFFCRIRNTVDSSDSYTTPAHFMPNRLTADANANGNTDVLRCPIKYTQDAYVNLAGSDRHIAVDILREEEGPPIVSFTIPWLSRQVGYMMTPAPGGSRFDAWGGRDQLLASKKTASNPSGKTASGAATSQTTKGKAKDDGNGRSDLYMCVGGMESPFDKRLLPLYAEFLEHHFQLGVKHIFIAATYVPGEKHMNSLLAAFRSYISDRLLTVTSSASGVAASDLVYGVNGISLGRDTVKVIFSNMCLYYAKGSADYVGVWVRIVLTLCCLVRKTH